MSSYLKMLILAVLTVFAPIKASVIAIFVLTVLDLITGVIAAHKEGQPITSAGFKRTVIKLALYEIALCAAFLVQQYLTQDLFPASKLVAAIVGLTELKSMLENMDRISGDKFFVGIIAKVSSAKDDAQKPPTP